MFQCVGFQLFCPGVVFMKYFSNPNISLLQNPDLQKKLQSLQAHITSLSEQQVALWVPTYIFGNKILVGTWKITCKYRERVLVSPCKEGGKKLKFRVFISLNNQSENAKIPWDLLQVWHGGKKELLCREISPSFSVYFPVKRKILLRVIISKVWT